MVHFIGQARVIIRDPDARHLDSTSGDRFVLVAMHIEVFSLHAFSCLSMDSDGRLYTWKHLDQVACACGVL